MESAFNVFVFVLFAALWVGFAYALITSQGSLDAAWRLVTTRAGCPRQGDAKPTLEAAPR